MGRIICTLSGGVASAHAAALSIEKYGKSAVVLYFNDTKWEHPDLYRFLKDLSRYFDVPITEDSDGRSVEDVAWDNNALPNNRMPFCSRILKANRLQKFYQDTDILIFGIGPEEAHRAQGLQKVYKDVGTKSKKTATLEFPLIDGNIQKADTWEWLKQTGIAVPELYLKGFSHNNCYGGCVRAGKKQWRRLFLAFPEIYAQREQLEKEMSEHHGKRCTFLKDESLEEFRIRIQTNQLGKYYDDDFDGPSECIGICTTQN